MRRTLGLAGATGFATAVTAAPIELTSATTFSYSQNFNTLGTTGTANPWTDNSTIPAWYAKNSGATPFADYSAGTGTSNAGDLYSFGATGDPERALGSIVTDNVAAGIFAYGVLLHNTSGSVISQLQVIYHGEQWRDSGSAAVQSLTFSYRISSSLAAATDLEPATAPGGAWAAVAQLDFASPQHSGSATALDGNAPANSQWLNVVFSGFTLNHGDYIMLRWRDINDGGSDHGLAMDNFILAVPEPRAAGAVICSALVVGGTWWQRRRQAARG